MKEEDLIKKLLEILKKEPITIKGNVLSIGNQKIKISNRGNSITNIRPIQIR